MRQKIITLGSDREFLTTLEVGIDEESVGFLQAPSGKAGLSLHESLHVDLVIAVLPLDDVTADELLMGLRTVGAALMPRVVFVAGGQDYVDLKGEEREGVTILSADDSNAELRKQCSRFLRGSPRAAERIMARLEVKLGSEKALRAVQMRDVSATGMRIATRELLPIGTWVRLEFDLPGDPDPIRVDAEVVRHAVGAVEEQQGMGIRFTAFEGNGGARLRRHIRHRIDEE